MDATSPNRRAKKTDGSEDGVSRIGRSLQKDRRQDIRLPVMSSDPSLSIALYQPDMPTNTGAILRLGACLEVPIDIIEPCGFIWDDKKLKRVAMDYIDHCRYVRHKDWESFKRSSHGRRLVLLTTKGAVPYGTFSFQKDDILLLGRESAGVPQSIHDQADARLYIPMKEGLRSLNVALSAAMVLGEALRQTS